MKHLVRMCVWAAGALVHEQRRGISGHFFFFLHAAMVGLLSFDKAKKRLCSTVSAIDHSSNTRLSGNKRCPFPRFDTVGPCTPFKVKFEVQ